MATLRIPEEGRVLRDQDAVRERLAAAGILYERWTASRPLQAAASADEVLSAYAPEIERLKSEGGYVTADLIDVRPETPGLEVILERFRREHWHDEDEVRFVVEGRGIFHIHPPQAPVLAVQVGADDLLRVPRGTRHWFDLCAERRIRAIRLFQDPAGWTPHYTQSGAEQGFEPVCLGPSDLPAAGA
jgi:1,2-dihydroxy-3-keto-5-methylthiopentene dioxygenase